MGVQETIKQQLTDAELESLAPGKGFTWNWIAAKGHSGGIFLGVREDVLLVEDWWEGEFYMAATIRNRLDNWGWNIMVVYGSANHVHSRRFLDELGTENMFLPTIMGGDFNLIREEKDKSNGVVERGLMRAFNEFIEKNDLREIHKVGGGGRFTWSNNQDCPVMSNIDRVLVTTEWENRFPKCVLSSFTRVGSDHNPILLDTGGRWEEGSNNRFSLKDNGIKWMGSQI